MIAGRNLIKDILFFFLSTNMPPGCQNSPDFKWFKRQLPCSNCNKNCKNKTFLCRRKTELMMIFHDEQLPLMTIFVRCQILNWCLLAEGLESYAVHQQPVKRLLKNHINYAMNCWTKMRMRTLRKISAKRKSIIQLVVNDNLGYDYQHEL